MFRRALVVALIATLPGGASAQESVVSEPQEEQPAGLSVTPDEVDAQLAAGPKAVVLGTLDKITARVSDLVAPIDKPVTFGTLEITARACNSTPPEEPPETSAFLEIREHRRGEDPSTVFVGWMFASSPALSAMEHPVYDVWVLSCTTLSPDTDNGSAKKSADDDTASRSSP
ncbi:MAG: DUF2155 domain-containing protein [Alphaproteobacteria bacterium]|nr:MAG: DUF2155 domain-containing protein [Alphaproteobacteria bacterium]